MSDDELNDLDLSPWQPPEPSVGLADAVLARMREPVAAAAFEPELRGARGLWIGAVAAMVGVALVLVIVLRGTERAAPAAGGVLADRARSLDLGTTTAELDPGAVVTWHRRRDGLAISQLRGVAGWHVGDGESSWIDTGVMGTLVEASGASLRVEVHMNATDARVIGASAVTAAAVAFVTVVVYEGHVKATSGGQTVEVQPGATVELHGGEAPRAPDLVGHADANVRLHVNACVPADPSTAAGVAPIEPAATTCDAEAFKDKGINDLTTGQYAAALAQFEAAIRCKPDPRGYQLAYMAACNSRNVTKARTYYRRLSPDARARFAVMCIRNNITKAELDADDSPTPVQLDTGDTRSEVQLFTDPAGAKVIVDGVDTGRVTPVSQLMVVPGKHEVTFVISAKRYAYPLVVQPGKTTKRSYKLESLP
jgi:hypothetical protein